MIEVISHPMCSGCAELKRTLARAGLIFWVHDVTGWAGLAVAAFHDVKDGPFPVVIVNGERLSDPQISQITQMDGATT